MRDRNRAGPRSSSGWLVRHGALLAVIAALVFVAFVRLRLADVPLERDEGEYAYAGRLILEGVPPYRLAYNMKFPGTYYAYAAILALFGRTPWGIHVGLMLVNAATIALVYHAGRRVLDEFAGGVAAVSFAMLSLDRWVLGVFAHATHFVVLFALAGLLLLLRAMEDRGASPLVGSGVLLGLAVLMKQHAIFFLPLAAVLVLWSERRNGRRDTRAVVKRIGMLALGALLPLAAAVILLLAQGVLERFWFWTFRYASAYVSELPLSRALPQLAVGFRAVTTASWVTWVLGGLGLVALWIVRWEARARVFLTGLLVASFLATCPGFFFRNHYFILILPAVALLVGVALASLRRILERTRSRERASALAAAVLVAATGVYVVQERDYLFSMDARELIRTMYGVNPFIEAAEVGTYIRDRTNKDDRIAVLGSEPEIYFYADRTSATGYVYTYALMEPQPFAATMQAEMMREVESAHPRYLVFSQIGGSWLARKDSDRGIVAWGNRYVQQCYEPVGVVDVYSKDESRVLWDDAVRAYKPASDALMYTFRRKSDAPCTVAGGR